MDVPVVMPQLGLTMTEGTVTAWLKRPGDKVARGEMLFVVSTDKTDMEVESLTEGTLKRIVVELGRTVPVGAVIAYLERPGEETIAGTAMGAVASPPPPAQTSPEGVSAPTPEIAPAASEEARREGPLASPRARRLARELGVDLSTVRGTGAGGRIVEEDIRKAAGRVQFAVNHAEGLSMGTLAKTIAGEQLNKGCLAVYWLSQAGFVFKTSRGKIAYVDPYFSDLVERVVGFKRMMACPIAPAEVVADLVACTHEHPDHLDTDALPVLAANSRTHFAGPVECVKEFKRAGVPEERCHQLEVGKEIVLEGIKVKAVYADHGEFAPDAVGIVFDFEGIQVYHTGDTAYRPEHFQPVVEMRPDILLPCINGRFGNLTAEEAARLARDINPRLVIASHFWMFVEHNGDPAAFLESCAKLAPGVKAVVMKPGERYLFQKS